MKKLNTKKYYFLFDLYAIIKLIYAVLWNCISIFEIMEKEIQKIKLASVERINEK